MEPAEEWGHWSGDAACPKSSNKPGKAKGKGKNKSKKPGSANMVSSAPFPTYYTLTQDDMEAYADMVHAEQDRDEEANEMPVDGGDDGRRRRIAASRSPDASSWSEVSPNGGYAGEIVIGGAPYRPVSSLPSADEVEALRASSMKVHPVALSAEERVKPNLALLRVGQLQELCVTNDIAYSNLNKAQLVERLDNFYEGRVVPKRGSAKNFVKMTALEDEAPLDQTPIMSKQTNPASSTLRSSPAASVRSGPATPKVAPMNIPWSPATSPGMIEPQGRFNDDPNFMEGIPIYHLPCSEWGKFFGCTNFSPRGCRFMLTYEEGVSRFRSSLADLQGQVLETRSAGSGRQ